MPSIINSRRAASFGKTDRIFPTFIVTQMPHGISGLLIAAILAAAMSNLSAALNSLSSSSIVDFYARRHPEASEQKRVRLSRVATVVWGLILFVLAILSRQRRTCRRSRTLDRRRLLRRTTRRLHARRTDESVPTSVEP